MNQRPEDTLFERFRRTGSTDALAEAFDATAPELWRVAWYLAGGDRALAEDGLQSTFLTAIEDRDRWDASRPLRPWLLGILANHVRNQRRKSKRAAGEPTVLDALPSEQRPDDRAAELELRAAVTDAIRAQSQPYREVLSLHLEHGLSAQDIANALDRKAGTVRTQIARGLEMLRSALPVGAAIAAFALPDSAIAAKVLGRVREAVVAHGSTVVVACGATTLSVLLRPKAILMLTSAVACLVATVLLWPDEPSAPPAFESERVDSIVVDANDAREDRSSRTHVPTNPPVERDESPPPSAPRHEFRVRVVSSVDESPRPNTHVMFRGDRRLHYARTDADGRCSFHVDERPQHFRIGLVGSHAFEWGTHLHDQDHEFVLRVEPGMHLAVRVVDSAGSPVPGALVEGVLGSQWDRMYNPLGRTDAEGMLRLTDTATRGQLRAYAPGHQMSRLKNIEGKIGETLEVTMTLGATAVAASGTVVDEDGEPIADAEIAIVQFGSIRPSSQYLASDDDGRFRIDWLEPGPHMLIVRKFGADVTRIGSMRFEHRGGAEPELRLEARPAQRIAGRITRENGDPIVQAGISMEFTTDGVYDVPFTEHSMRTDQNGTYEFYGLMPGTYRCRAYDEQAEVRGEVIVVENASNEWSVALPELRRMQVKLVDARGAPVAGWRVSMQSLEGFGVGPSFTTNADGIAGAEPWEQWKAPPGKLHAFTAAAPVPEGVAGLRDWEHDYFPTVVAPPIDPASLQPYVIRVPDGVALDASIRGRLIDRNAQVRQRANVRIFSKRAPRSSGVTIWADDETGEFEITPLSPGTYTLWFRIPGEPAFKRVVELGNSERADLLDVRAPEIGTVTVIRDADGSDDRLTVRIESGGMTFYAKRHDDGAYVADNVHRGEATLIAWGRQSAPIRHTIRVEQSTSVPLVLHRVTPTPLHITLPADQARYQQSWSGTVRVFEPKSRTLLVSRELRHNFRGTYTSNLAFDLPLDAGEYFIELESWDDRWVSQRIELPRSAIDLRVPTR